MSVTPHVMPYAIDQIGKKAISLTGDTFQAYLSGTAISTWGSTQEAYKFVSDFLTPYPEVSGGGYARVTLAGLLFTYSAEKNIWTCTSPISFGASVTISAASMVIFDHTVGGTDATSPVITAIDFGGTVTSTSGPWTYTVDGTNGLAYWTES